MSTGKNALKRAVGPSGQHYLRKLGRARFIQKAGQVRRSGGVVRDHLRYILTDPEVDNFTYDLDNEAELAAGVADVLGASPARVLELFAEAHGDPVLRNLGAPLRLRVDTKRRLPPGKRLAWYAAARLRRPEVAVECGILDGFGSAILLAALERNAAEGGPDGRLLSFDLLPGSGRLVPAALRHRWEPVYEGTPGAIVPALRGRTTGLLISDVGTDDTRERAEYETALAHSDRPVVLIAGSAQQSDVLATLAAEHGVTYREVRDRPRDHFYPGQATGLASFA